MHGRYGMTKFSYFIYRLETRPGAQGQYIGPFESAEERDGEAKRLRKEGRRSGLTQCVYRADIEADLVEEIGVPTIVAA